MPHFPKPFFKKARGVWYVEINRKQFNLGSNKDEAFRQYHQLMGKPREQAVSPDSLLSIIEAFLEWSQKNRAPATYEWYRFRLQRFALTFPEMRDSDFKPFHVEQWVDQYVVAQTTRRNYFRSIKRCLSWARRQGRIDINPLEALDVPGAEPKDVYVPPDEFEKLLTFVPDSRFRDLLVTTYQTGCRPQESLRVVADWVDVKHARWVFPSKKSKGKRMPRIIYLNNEALSISDRLLQEHPSGELFLNRCDRPWTTAAVNCCFGRIQNRMGKVILKERGEEPDETVIRNLIETLTPAKCEKGVVREKRPAELREEAKRKLFKRMASEVAPRYSLYALRHSWATNALKRGVDPLTVALLMGHKDPSMLARVYQHLSHSPDHMRDQARKATEGDV
ncbi:MAG: site-specific integrase [Planctomycetaceae bacterium]|nr:site-specific integrase [Planctomycetaceae bacterium]